MNTTELKSNIKSARNKIMFPARELANAVEERMLRDAFGDTFVNCENGFSVHGVQVVINHFDHYGNLSIAKITKLPKVDQLKDFVNVIMYFYNDDIIYSMRPVSCFLIDLLRAFEEEIAEEYLDEMLRLGDEFCEVNSGFRKWLVGTPPGSGHLGATPNCPRRIQHWFPEIAENEELREHSRKSQHVKSAYY